jgi:hypothetical protein
MSNKAHLDEIEEQAAMFALGALPPEESHQLQQRVAAGCPVCRAMLGDFGRTVATLALAAPPAEPRPELRARILRSVGAPVASPAPAPVGEGTAFGEGTIVRPDDTAWVPASYPGVQYRALRGRRTMLVRMRPNSWLPAHDHAAAEQCLVLEGSIRADGVTAVAGDYTYMPKGSHHQPLYSPEGCLLLIAYT